MTAPGGPAAGAELAARRTAAAAVLADYRAALASAPLGSPPGREWMLRLAGALGDLLDGLGQEGKEEYTAAARAALGAAATAEHDFAGWLAAVLAAVAAGLGSSGALVQGRPGSWEAADVLHLVRGTAGYGDEYLDSYRPGALWTGTRRCPLCGVTPRAPDSRSDAPPVRAGQRPGLARARTGDEQA